MSNPGAENYTDPIETLFGAELDQDDQIMIGIDEPMPEGYEFVALVGAIGAPDSKRWLVREVDTISSVADTPSMHDDTEKVLKSLFGPEEKPDFDRQLNNGTRIMEPSNGGEIG